MTSTVLTSIRDRVARIDIAAMGLALLLIVTSLLRIIIGADKPLLLDEIWTAVIATQPSLEGVIHRCLIDVNGPLYSVLATLWEKASGPSNQALRTLPLVLGLLAPLVALTPRRMIGRATRFTWCALLACWIPGIIYSEVARPYTLALLLAVLNTIMFAGVLKTPNLKMATGWMIASTLMILSHYYGFLLVGFQGLAYLWVHKARAARTWPAAVVLAPAFGVIALQAHQIQAFTDPRTSWISPPSLITDGAFIFGNNVVTLGLTASWVVIAIVIWVRSRLAVNHEAGAADASLWWAPACSAAAVIAGIGLGFMKPMFVERYLLEFVPGIFLGLAMMATDVARKWQTAALALIVIAATPAYWLARDAPDMSKGAFSWQAASNALMASHATHLAFVWDNPMRPDRNSLADLGGFFFARAGQPIPIDGVQLAAGEDPNRALMKSAATPGSAILWVYDLNVRGTSAIQFPPRIQQLDPRWGCRRFGEGGLGVVACDRAWASASK